MSKLDDWKAEDIYKRSKNLLGFMEERWQFDLDEAELDRLIYVTFAIDGRDIPEELVETI